VREASRDRGALSVVRWLWGRRRSAQRLGVRAQALGAPGTSRGLGPGSGRLERGLSRPRAVDGS